MTVETRIRRVGCMDILGAPNAKALLEAYAEDCLMPGAESQVEIYQYMESAGVLACFGAYADQELVGFVTVVSSVMPHNGKRAASIESLFVDRRYRDLGVGRELLDAANGYARSTECVVLTMTARVASALATVLEHRQSCTLTHVVFTEWL